MWTIAPAELIKADEEFNDYALKTGRQKKHRKRNRKHRRKSAKTKKSAKERRRRQKKLKTTDDFEFF